MIKTTSRISSKQYGIQIIITEVSTIFTWYYKVVVSSFSSVISLNVAVLFNNG